MASLPAECALQVSNSKKKKRNDSGEASNLCFPIVVTKSMIKEPYLSLPIKTCNKMIWSIIPPKPRLKLNFKDKLGKKGWIIQSNESSFEKKQTVKFTEGWEDVKNFINMKEGDILTFKKKRKGQYEYGVHVYRWNPLTHGYMTITPCDECPKAEPVRRHSI